MPTQRAKRVTRGAIAGAIAAGIWAAQMPLDKRALGDSFDDVELLGKALTTGPHSRKVGWALHLQNGALFGAAYAELSPRMPLPAWARGPAVAIAENFATWPLTAVTDRIHPARKELPKAFSNPRALLLSTWRHLLFGTLLGEIERRLNASDEALPADEDSFVPSSNGHRELELVGSPN